MSGTVWTVIIAAAIFVYVALVIRSMYLKRKSGKSSCYGCPGCASHGHDKKDGGCDGNCSSQ